MNRLVAILAAVCCLAFPAAAAAAPVTWTLNGVTFTDGATASGSFVYDATTNVYSSVNITTTTATRTGATYVAAHPVYVSSGILVSLTASGTTPNAPAYQMVFSANLTDAGGNVPLALAGNSSEGECNATCLSYAIGPVVRDVASGSVVGTPAPTIPTLSEWAMILFGLLLAGGAAMMIQRRRLA